MDLDLEGQNLDDLNEKINHKPEVHKIKSAGTVTISSELFEKVHTLRFESNIAKLVQQKYSVSDAHKFANPTPLAFQG